MAKARITSTKKQREQKKRERKEEKLARKKARESEKEHSQINDIEIFENLKKLFLDNN